jgi:hypothetical protein
MTRVQANFVLSVERRGCRSARVCSKRSRRRRCESYGLNVQTDGRLQSRRRTDALVGYLLQRPGLCEVTVLTAAADDEALVSPPERMKIDIAAAGRSELPAGDGSALAIACTADADAIKIAPQYQKKLVVAP